MRLPRHPRADLRRRGTDRPRPVTAVLHRRPGRGSRPGRRPGRFFPLTTHPATSRPPGFTTLRPWSTHPGSRGPTPGKQNAATPTRASEPTAPCGHPHADSSPWSCYHSTWNDPKLKVLRAPRGCASVPPPLLDASECRDLERICILSVMLHVRETHAHTIQATSCRTIYEMPFALVKLRP